MGHTVNVLASLLRWLLVPVVVVAVAAITAAGGRWVVMASARHCSPGYQAGGACVEPWHTGVIEASIYGGLLVAVPAAVMLSALTAPALKRSIAVSVLLTVLGVLLYLYRVTGWAQLLMPVAVAAVCGVGALWWVFSRNRTA